MVNKTTGTIAPAGNNLINEELAKIGAAGALVRDILNNAQHELERAKQTRAKAELYQREIQAKANSQAQLLILQARLKTRKEITELKNKFSEQLWKEMPELKYKSDEELKRGIIEFKRMIGEQAQKEITEFKRKINEELMAEIARFKQTLSKETKQVLNELHEIRIAANEELKAQKRVADAARIHVLSLTPEAEDNQRRSNGNGGSGSTKRIRRIVTGK